MFMANLRAASVSDKELLFPNYTLLSLDRAEMFSTAALNAWRGIQRKKKGGAWYRGEGSES